MDTGPIAGDGWWLWSRRVRGLFCCDSRPPATCSQSPECDAAIWKTQMTRNQQRGVELQRKGQRKLLLLPICHYSFRKRAKIPRS